jgi:hypothetical protein
VLDAVRECVRVVFAVESSTVAERGERIAPYVTPAGRRAVDRLLETKTPADPMEAERDSALAMVEEADPEGTLDRWLSVSTAPLADRLRAITPDERQRSGPALRAHVRAQPRPCRE